MDTKSTHLGKRDLLKYFLIYTILFLGICALVFRPFLSDGKSLVWKIDGIPQYMLWLQYTGKYIRDLIKSISSGTLNVPMYDFNIGMGNDVRSFFKTEPVEFLGTLLIFGTRGTSKLYNLLTIFRIYLIGVSFSCYGFYMKKQPLPVLSGALLYTFSSYTIYQVERHPQFVVPAIMLPLLLIGLERVIRKEGYLFFSLTVAISLMASYYFLYMNTLIMGLYALLRFRDICTSDRIREFFFMVGRIIRNYLLGVGMTLVFFIPSVAGFFLSARKAGGNKASAVGSFLSYGKYRLVDEFLSLTAPVRQGPTLTTISVGAMIIPVLVLLFLNRDKEKLSLKLGFLVGLIFLMIPFFGYVFSGFSTVNNRWSFAFVFILAVIMMLEFDSVLSMTLWQYGAICMIVALYALCRHMRSPGDKAYLFSLILMVLVVLVIGMIRFLPAIPDRLSRIVLILLVCGTVAFNGYYMNSGKYGNLVSEFQNEATVNGYFTSSRYKLLKKIRDDGFYRVDTDMMYHNYNNVAVALGFNGISLYQSTINSSVIAYYKESENVGISALNRTLFLDNRTVPEGLACVKYYITFKDSDRTVPYGFEPVRDISDQSETYDVYQNKYALPIGYNYNRIISRSEYEKANVLQQQQIQLNAAVVNDEDLPYITGLDLADSGDLPVISEGSIGHLQVDEGIVKEGNTYTVNKTNKTDWVPENNEEDASASKTPRIRFTATSRKGCEVYLRLKNATCSHKQRRDINVYTQEIKKRAIVRSKADTYGLGISNYLVNLGYYEEEKEIDVELSFSNPGKYTIEAFEIYYVPMDSYAGSIEGLKQGGLTDVSLTTNTVEGTTTSDRDHLVVFSIPYHIGWSAFVDDIHAEIFNVNTLYMGVKIPAGKHTVALEYHSPGIRIGVAVSSICWYIFILLIIRTRQKKRKPS